MPKIIQITSCGHNNTPRTQSDGTLFALCEDGSLWAMPVEGGKWQMVNLPEIEETNEILERTQRQIKDHGNWNY